MLLLAQTAADACRDAGLVCRTVFDWTGSEVVASVADAVLGRLPKVLLIVLVALIAARVAKRLIRKIAAEAKETNGERRAYRLTEIGGGLLAPPAMQSRKSQRIDALSAVASSLARVVIWTIALLMILGTFNIDLGPLIAGAGIVGVALGFGAQNLVRDLLSGLFMLAEDQYGIGDIIDVGDASGVVEGISLRTTRLRDVYGTLWHVPNGEIRRVANKSQEWARVILDIGVAYDADVDDAARVILQTAVDMDADPTWDAQMTEEPELWGVEALGDSAVVLRLAVKCSPGDQWTIARELRRRIKRALDDASIEIPFPQRTVWLRDEGHVDA